jgi:MFS family permease
VSTDLWLMWCEFVEPFVAQPAFIWVFMSRFAYNLGFNVVSSYIYFFLHDLVGAPFDFFGLFTIDTVGPAMSLFMLNFLVGSVLSSLASGILSDKYGRKQLVYLAVALQCFATSAFLWTQNYGFLAALMAPLCGSGYGAYISVDWALASDALLHSAHLARDMGIWHLSFTAPSVIGVPLAGWMMATFRSLGDSLGISLLGHRLVLVFAVLCYAVGGLLIYPIQFPKHEATTPDDGPDDDLAHPTDAREYLDDHDHDDHDDSNVALGPPEDDDMLPIYGNSY